MVKTVKVFNEIYIMTPYHIITTESIDSLRVKGLERLMACVNKRYFTVQDAFL